VGPGAWRSSKGALRAQAEAFQGLLGCEGEWVGVGRGGGDLQNWAICGGMVSLLGVQTVRGGRRGGEEGGGGLPRAGQLKVLISFAGEIPLHHRFMQVATARTLHPRMAGGEVPDPQQPPLPVRRGAATGQQTAAKGRGDMNRNLYIVPSRWS